jgi:tRNA pseudouridine38-40 synthase
MRYSIEVQYNGTAFYGSQIQGNLPTVQFEVNKALSTILGKPIESYGASRTDEGVHALCNFYHFDWGLPINTSKLQYSLNAILPPALSILRLQQLKNDDANVRFDAISRTYRYRIYFKKNPFLYERAYLFPYTMNMEALNETAKILMEYTDFESFAKKNTQNKTTICQLFQSKWEVYENEIHYLVTGNRFLRGMVRALVGTQLRVARGKLSVEGFRSIIESKNCQLADFSVPGHGLYLEKITYPDDYFIVD